MSLQEFVNAVFVSSVSYRAAVYLSRYSDVLEDKDKKKTAKLISYLSFPLYIVGIIGVLTLGVLDHFEWKRLFRIHQKQANEVRVLAEAAASGNRLSQYRAASLYNAPGASAAYLKLESEIKDAKRSNDDWYVKHLESNGLDPDDPDYFDFDTWLQREYYKLGL